MQECDGARCGTLLGTCSEASRNLRGTSQVLAASNFPWDLDEARISAVPRLYLGCTLALSRLYLGCTSALSRLYLGSISARDLDEALRRRLEKRIYIPLPEPADIRTLLGASL